MSSAQKVIVMVGSIFAGIGGIMTVIFVSVADELGGIGGFIMLPLGFVILGLSFIGSVIVSNSKKKKIIKCGNKYAAKIYSYVENTSYLLNGAYTMNVIVHYFDKANIEREAILPTEFPKGSNLYPIGMTIDIYEYQGKYGFDPKSVRCEELPGERELMDDKPVNPTQLQMVAVTCPNCGSSFQAAAGYSSKCPYCGSYLNS
ncbi:MAG: hypothetical protein PUC73_01395 [Lachnospiraceae bacterium]|nr:hypothetical protein [Lachnospiraceae bacterium]